MLMKNQRGQALIELIIFLPLMITLYSVIGGFAGAINGSINQQKVTRSYFYYRIQNNSTIPGLRAVVNDMNSWSQFGMFYIGWKDYFKGGDESGGQPVMPCYKISIPFKENPADKCEDRYTRPQTLWVRVGTVYGICGATYLNGGNNQFFTLPDGGNANIFSQVISKRACIITR
jgi:hypothetical protein